MPKTNAIPRNKKALGPKRETFVMMPVGGTPFCWLFGNCLGGRVGTRCGWSSDGASTVSCVHRSTRPTPTPAKSGSCRDHSVMAFGPERFRHFLSGSATTSPRNAHRLRPPPSPRWRTCPHRTLPSGGAAWAPGGRGAGGWSGRAELKPSLCPKPAVGKTGGSGRRGPGRTPVKVGTRENAAQRPFQS